MERMTHALNRRELLRGAAVTGGSLAMAGYMPAWAQPVSGGILKPLPTVVGPDINLTIAHMMMTIDGREQHAIGLNGTVPGPLVRLRQGQNVRLSVTNGLKDEDTSIHWHGLLVPFQYDGVPGVSFPGIGAGKTFVYEFPVIQSGTYWYHSHSGLQEQLGHYGPIVVDPEGPDPIQSDREHVIVLSDHSPMHPHAIMRKLKQQSGYFNYQRQTLAGLLAGADQPFKERWDWGKMRMDPADSSDVTGSTYTYLVNGYGPFDNWTALFTPGERVRLRFVNASAMTHFDVRIPGLRMTVVQADGQNVRPVPVDEFQIGVAETYDVIVEPAQPEAFTLVAESVDRSGMARATLAPRAGMSAPVPPLRARPLATMRDMGMGNMGDQTTGSMDGMEGSSGRPVDPTVEKNRSAKLAKLTGWSGSAASASSAASQQPMSGMAGMNHAAMGHSSASTASGMTGMAGMAGMQSVDPGSAMAGMDHGDMAGMDMGAMNMRDFSKAPQVKRGPGVQTISPMPEYRMDEPGQGMERVGHKVLVYTDLVATERNPDTRPPDREMEIHLTGNMERYMWGFDGEKLSEIKDPIPFTKGERVRIKLVNDTMMSHPIHLHGHFFELVTGHGDFAPRKHTVMVQPGGIAMFDLTADAPGDWAFHCHLLYHMHAGMMQVVTVRPLDAPRTLPGPGGAG